MHVEKGNNELNFNLKIRKLQTNLDMWRSRDLTLFGKVLIIKSLGLSQLIYSASILNVPEEVARTVKTKLFSFLWKNKSNFSLQLNKIYINLYLNKIKTSDFYRLLCTKTHTTVHSGPRRWSKDLSLDEDTWEKIFASLKTVCRETRLKEFQYKLSHQKGTIPLWN